MAEAASAPQHDWCVPLRRRRRDTRVVQFLSGVVRTMQNRVDEAQIRVPGYRERVLHMSMSRERAG